MNIKEIQTKAEQIMEIEKQIKKLPKDKHYKLELQIEDLISPLSMAEVLELDEYIMTHY